MIPLNKQTQTGAAGLTLHGSRHQEKSCTMIAHACSALMQIYLRIFAGSASYVTDVTCNMQFLRIRSQQPDLPDMPV